MTEHQDKRQDKRYRHGAELTFSHFHSFPPSPTLPHKGEKVCHGAGGLRFKTECILKPGAILLIKLGRVETGGSEAEVYDGMRTISLGKVMWCRPSEADQGNMVGVKYLNC